MTPCFFANKRDGRSDQLTSVAGSTPILTIIALCAEDTRGVMYVMIRNMMLLEYARFTRGKQEPSPFLSRVAIKILKRIIPMRKTARARSECTPE